MELKITWQSVAVQCGPTHDQPSYSTGKFTFKASMSASITLGMREVGKGSWKDREVGKF